MSDLIKALQIFLKYGDPANPTNCSHDELYVDVDQTKVSAEDISALAALGFFPSRFFPSRDGDDYGFKSYRFGSC